jgi:hypothetical protein
LLGPAESASSSIPLEATAVPAEVVAIVDRLMAKRPADRFQTPAELAERLAAWQAPHAKSALAIDLANAKVGVAAAAAPAAPGAKAAGQGLDATLVVECKPAPQHGDTTQSHHGLRRPRRGLRLALVLAGFLLCCGIASRYLADQSSRADGQSLPDPAPTPALVPTQAVDSKATTGQKAVVRPMPQDGPAAQDQRK